MQQLIERPGFDPTDRLFPVDHALLDQRHGDLQRGLRGSLAGARLQHPQFTALNGEFDVLHVAVVVFECLAHLVQFSQHLGHNLFHRRQSRVVRLLAGDRQMLWGTDPGDDILALRIYQKLAVKCVHAGRRVAGKGDTGCAIRPHIAEHHRLHVDRSPPIGRDVVQSAIGDRARVHPGTKHGAYGAPQLLFGVLWERMTVFLANDVLETRDDRRPVLGGKIRVEIGAGLELMVFDQLLEMMVVDTEHDLPVHLDEPPIAVIRKTLVSALARQPDNRLVVETEIEHGIHHPGHRNPSSRPHRHEQRIVRIAKPHAERALERSEPVGHPIPQLGGVGFFVCVKVRADLGGDREAGRHRQAETAHLGETGTLAAQQVFHVGPALGGPVAKPVDPFRHPPLILRSAKNRRPGSWYPGCVTTSAADFP